MSVGGQLRPAVERSDQHTPHDASRKPDQEPAARREPPPLSKDGRRRAGDYVLSAARIQAEVACKPDDLLNGADLNLADTWLEAAIKPTEAEVPMIVGGELMPILEETDTALRAIKNTVEEPSYITADASRDRIQLAHDAGALETGLDLAESIKRLCLTKLNPRSRC